jgi:hypothetical protein
LKQDETEQRDDEPMHPLHHIGSIRFGPVAGDAAVMRRIDSRSITGNNGPISWCGLSAR